MRLTTNRPRLAAWALLGTTLVYLGCSAVLTTLSHSDDTPRPAGSETATSEVAFLLAVVAFAAVGFLIVRQQPDNAIGWLLGVNGLLLGWLDLTSVFIWVAVQHDLASGSGVVTLMALTNWTWVPTVGLLAIFVVLLFPDGHLPSPRWSWLPWTAVATMTMLSVGVLVSPDSFDNSPLAGRDNPFAVELPGWVVAGEGIVFSLFAGCMLASAAAAVGRYRRSRGVERMQMKWLAFAGAFFAGIFVLIALAGFVPWIEGNEALGAVVDLALPLAILAFPLAIGAAVLKHGLYEIDAFISRTVVFATLAGFITTVYVATVVGLGSLLGRGEEPNLALSVAATAVVAVAFQPVRDRVQRFANRLVYGERATPYEVLSEFAERVGGTVDVADLLPTMARTVAQGVGAVRVDIWLLGEAGWLLEATWPAGATGEGTRVRSLTELHADRVAQVRHGGDLLGAIALTKPADEILTPADDKLLDDVAAQAGLVLRNVRLIEDLRRSRQRLVSTADEERRRLERNLHDGAQQSLVSVALMINMARTRLAPDLVPSVGPALEQAAEQLRAAIEELRELARGIHPAILTERGLCPAVSSLAERSPVPVVVDCAGVGRLPAAVEATVYFLVAEALTNVAKYAHATEAVVMVSSRDGDLSVQVSDDGIGGADESEGSGLRGLADRVAVVGGTLALDSPPGRGTRLTCTIPARAGVGSVGDSGPEVMPAIVREAVR